VSLQASILVAGDDETTARLLKRLLTREGHHVRIVTTGDEALKSCAAAPPDLVLIDLFSPQGHSAEVCRQLKAHPSTRFIPVIVVTPQFDRQDRLASIDAGADEFIAKPFDAPTLQARIRSLVKLKRQTDELESAEAVILGLGATIEARDPCTQGHCQRLASYATSLGRSLGLDEEDLSALKRGGFLHDIGKIGVPDAVLLKEGRLSVDESKVMREHPIIGDGLCTGMRSLQRVRPIVRSHHERLDGSGYPDGLKNMQVPLLAQVITVVDIFDALTTDRPYRGARPPDEALNTLADEASKGWLDRSLVDAFADVLKPVP